jgi:single-strand DNA-binding protein
MGKDLNVVNMIGRATRDAEMKHVSGGTLCICNFSIAVNNLKGSKGNYTEEVSFFDCTMFGKLAGNAGKYVTKGKQIAIEGRLKQECWEDSDGLKRNKIKIIVHTIQLLGGNGPTIKKTEDAFKADKSMQFEDDVAF